MSIFLSRIFLSNGLIGFCHHWFSNGSDKMRSDSGQLTAIWPRLFASSICSRSENEKKQK